MVDTTRIDEWLERYRGAWTTDDPAEIGRLFADDVRCFTAPFTEPLEGIDEVTAYWLGEAESGIIWTFEYEVLASEGDLFVVRAVTRYPEGTRDAGGRARCSTTCGWSP
jgi:ketosteroid isomerase-like protein